MARFAIAEFGIIQKGLAGATVTIYVADENGENTGVKATLYQAGSGTEQRNNPQVLDSDGKLVAPCYVETTVMATISNISDAMERSVRKIRVNPLDYPLPTTSAGANIATTVAAAATATAAANTATTQAGIATTQAGNAATSASTATTQAGIATTQAGIATTQAGTATTQAGIATTQAAIATAAAAGQKLKTPARAATTGALPTCTYNNGASGVGATLTATANGALPAQDTITLVAGEALLVKNQASAQHNGLYTVTQVGTGGTPWILTRLTDSDTWSEIVAALVTVMEGSVGTADTQFLCTSNAGGTMGTTAITWTQTNANIANGAVSTAAKIANGIITYAKMLATEFATVSDIISGAANKFVDAVGLKAYMDTKYIINPMVNVATGSPVLVDIVNGVGGQSIPSNAKRITINFQGVSTNGTSTWALLLRSTGFEVTGYAACSTEIAGSTTTLASTTAFPIRANTAANIFQGSLVLTLMDVATNTWALSGAISNANGTAGNLVCSGVKSLGSVLQGLRLTTAGGTDAFDAGNIQVTVET